MTNNQYLEMRNKLYDTMTKATMRDLGVQYQRLLTKTITQVELLYAEIMEASKDGTLLASDLHKFNRYFELVNELQAGLERLGIKEQIIIEDKLVKMYEQNSKLTGQAFKFYTPLEDLKALDAVNGVWCTDGLCWSDRVWMSKDKLKEVVMAGVVDAVVKGESRENLIRIVQKDFNSTYAQADRLVRTELSYVQNKSAIDRYKSAGIDYYEILVEPDCCDDCDALAGKQFKIDEQILPVHPNCKCCAVPVLSLKG